MDALLLQASASAIPLRDESVQTVVTSPPYWGLRAYSGEQRLVWGGEAGHEHEWQDALGGEGYAAGQKRKWQHGATRDEEPEGWSKTTNLGGFCACGAWYGALGLEPTPELFVEHMVEVFREVRRVLRRDGTLWLNLGDSYAANRSYQVTDNKHTDVGNNSGARVPPGLKPKDLVGIPWRVAFALQADGWYLRSDIIWHKPNPMPESVTDRPTKAHEYLFLLTKSERYFYDADAVREAASENTHSRGTGIGTKNAAIPFGDGIKNNEDFASAINGHVTHRNKRTVWTIPTRPYPGAHFATFPEQLVEPCILAGSSPQACGICGAPWKRVTDGGADMEARYERGEPARHGLNGAAASGASNVGGFSRERTTTGWRSTCAHDDDSGHSLVLDPFAGSGTTLRVAIRHGRSAVGLDISTEYLRDQATKRVSDIQIASGL